MDRLTVPVQQLEKTNDKLRQLLETLGPADVSPTLNTQDVAAVFTEVMQVGEWLRDGLARNAEGPMANELARYHQHLEQLRQILPRIHGHLLTERARLEAERTHLEAAAAWARFARKHTSG